MKVGAACKWVDASGISVPEANFRTTTVRRLLTMKETPRHELLLGIVKHNTRALRRQLRLVAAGPEDQRMWRLSSELLPMATHEVAQSFYRDSDVQDLIDHRLSWCGDFARKYKLRLSFHPGQFVVLGSQNPGIRENSRRELQYHCECFTRMGYSGWHPDGLAVNIHVGVKDADVKAMRKLLKSSQDIQNFVTLENDEFSWGTQQILDVFGDLVPLVLDVHHHWLHEGRRLPPDSSVVRVIRNTWRGIQPKLHLAMSDPQLCAASPGEQLVLNKLLAQGHTKMKLRAHCAEPWHLRSIDYAARFGFDILWEGKNKNLGAAAIAKRLRGK